MYKTHFEWEAFMIREPTFLASAKNYFDSYLRLIDLKAYQWQNAKLSISWRPSPTCPVRGLYEFKLKINTKFIKHKFYEPLILGIDFIQEHQL